MKIDPQLTTILIGDTPPVWECRNADGSIVGWIEQRDIGYVAIVGTGRKAVVEFEAALKAVERMARGG